jgi:carbamate kinase
MLVVMALGGNALLRRNEPLELELQRQHLMRAVSRAVAPICREHQVVITHGNGPQIGLLALQMAAYRRVRPYSLDVLSAESAGMIGYLIQQELANELPHRDVGCLLTQVEIDAADPAFRQPSKPIGPLYGEGGAKDLAAGKGWTFMRDGEGFRRSVPSPMPRHICEINMIKTLLDTGSVVICAGGGGIPVTKQSDGMLRGVEAVIDKDHTAALLAELLGADALLLLTDVPAVWARWPIEGEPIGRIRAAELRRMPFAPGSMGPKVEAACRFVENTGKTAGIGAIEQAQDILAGRTGTNVTKQ